MQELDDLREHITAGRTEAALDLIQELDDMSRKTVLLNIESYLARALMHLIKMDVEKKLTSSWRASIEESLVRIYKLNRMNNRTAHYIRMHEWELYCEEAFDEAVLAAKAEVHEGKYGVTELETLVNKERLMKIMMDILPLQYAVPFKEFIKLVDTYLMKEQQNTTL
jgi:hypothetical protein